MDFTPAELADLRLAFLGDMPAASTSDDIVASLRRAQRAPDRRAAHDRLMARQAQIEARWRAIHAERAARDARLAPVRQFALAGWEEANRRLAGRQDGYFSPVVAVGTFGEPSPDVAYGIW
jgi:hypothetical protein